ncbi:carbohydrate ABC transporter permease [Taklimakanibacter lacteus]|uniref:carbohydrate ABC transporter permease n=1 Tax=Taklimakanibacter lacteus TaxID=2268456 RepID=UPI000E668541
MADTVRSQTPAPPRTAEISTLSFALVVSVPVLIFLLVVVAYPLAYALYLSFHEIRFFGGYSATWNGIANYSKVLTDQSFWSSLGRSLRFTVVTVILTLAVGLGLALILKHLPGKWRWLRALIILPWAVSPYGAGILFTYLGRGQTGIGTALANWLGSEHTVALISASFVIEYLAVGAAWNMAPLVAFFLLANMLTTPARLYDLAKIDQMSPLETFRHVTLPPLRFTLFVFSCITTVLAMKTFDYIFTATQGGPGSASAVLTYTLYKISFVNLDLGYGAAMSFFLLAVILGATGLLYLLWGRREERQ